MIADSLEPLQYPLPLLPIELSQEGAQSLNERILEQSLAVRFGDEEAVQADTQSLGDLFQRPQVGVICPLSMRER